MIGRCAVLFAAGTALQFLMGGLNPSFLSYPWGIVLAVNYLYVLIHYHDKYTMSVVNNKKVNLVWSTWELCTTFAISL